MKKNGRLKRIMFEKGITQRELAEKTGICRVYLSLHINGRVNLKDLEKLRVAEALGCKVSDVFEG